MYISERLYCSRCLREMEEEGVCPFCGYDEDEVPFDPQVLEEGTLLGGKRYRIGALIGKGGFGMTYAAWDQTLLSPVAIKEYFPTGFVSRDIRETNAVQVLEEDRMVFAVGLSNFNREAHILAALQNVPHVVKVSNCFEENGTGYIVMEYVRGVTLREYVTEHQPGGDAVLKMLREPIDSLALIHQQGVMHRDITPNNLMVQEDGTITLIDFGAAFVDEKKLLGKSYAIAATKHYAAPEQYDPAMQQGQWTDVYGLSATTYALLTGCEPPDSQERLRRDTLIPPSKVRGGVSRRQERAILSGLAVDPKNRLRSVDEFRALLYNLPTPESIRQRKRIVRRMTALTAALLTLTLLIAANFITGLPLGEGLLYSLRADGWHITGATDAREERTLPDRLLFLPVVRVAQGAFEDDDALVRLTIPGSVKTVSRLALSGCDFLERVTLEEGVQEIGQYAFSGCPSLYALHLPESLSLVEENAFINAPPYLTAWLSRDSAVRSLCENAGLSCAVREDYDIRPEGEDAVLTAYRGGAGDVVLPSVIDGYRITQMDAQGLFWAFPKNTTSLTYPYFLTEVPGGELFYQPGALKRVTLGPDVVRIGEKAFTHTGITHIDLPDGLETIGEKAFYFSDLKEVVIPDSVREIAEGAFDYTALERVVIPDTVKTFGSDAFASNSALTEVVFPETLQIEILTDIFYGCSALERITIPKSVREIDTLAFSGCLSLEAVNLPEGLEAIDYGAFSDCIGLKYIGIPASVTEISQNAFDGCSADLVIGGFPGTYAQQYAEQNGYRFEDRSLWTPGMVKDGVIDATRMQGGLVCPVFDEETNSLVGTVAHIYADTSAGAAPITSIRLPLFAQEIGLGAISGLKQLEEVILPDSLRVIDSLALEENPALRHAALPEGLKILEGSAFADCLSLEDVVLPRSLELLGSAAFFGCAALKEIEIPPKLTVLDFRVFSGSGLESVVIPSNIRVCHDAFSDCAALISAKVCEGVRKMYGTFENCAALETVTLPSTLAYLSWDTFLGCPSLQEITFDSMDMTLWFMADGETFPFSPESFFYHLERGEEIRHAFEDSPNVTIRARAGSAAQMYAQVFDLAFELIEE